MEIASLHLYTICKGVIVSAELEKAMKKHSRAILRIILVFLVALGLGFLTREYELVQLLFSIFGVACTSLLFGIFLIWIMEESVSPSEQK